jgi:hypothetical protein
MGFSRELRRGQGAAVRSLLVVLVVPLFLAFSNDGVCRDFDEISGKVSDEVSGRSLR